MAPNSTSEKVSLGTNLTVLELKFLYYLHVLHTLIKSCFDITDIITNSVFIIVQAVENVGLSCAQCCICLTYVGELFLFVCLFVFFSCFPFLVRPCNLLGCSPTKPLATHTSYYGLARKIVYLLQIPRKARVKTSIVSSLKLKESPTARDLRKPNALSSMQLCLKEFHVDKLSKFF